MSIDTIITTLTQQQRLLPEELLRLQAHRHQEVAFFECLIALYEEKVQRYLSVCFPRIKKLMVAQQQTDPEMKAYESVISSTYALFTALNHLSFIQSLRMLLIESSPDLLISLGLAGKGMKSVFVHYVARYRLFHEINQDDLRTLCQATENHPAGLFPSHLFNAFLIEKHFSDEARQRQAQTPIHQILVSQMQRETQMIYQGLLGVITYLADTNHYRHLDAAYRQQHFGHLNSPQIAQQFIQAVGQGYMAHLSRVEQQQAIYVRSSSLIDNKTSQICFPALSLLGLTVNIDIDAFAQVVREYDAQIERIKACKSTIDAQIDGAKQEAHRKIDEQRANIQLPELLIGFKIQGMAFNLR